MTGGTVEYCTVFGNVQKESVGAEAGLFVAALSKRKRREGTPRTCWHVAK